MTQLGNKAKFGTDFTRAMLLVNFRQLTNKNFVQRILGQNMSKHGEILVNWGILNFIHKIKVNNLSCYFSKLFLLKFN